MLQSPLECSPKFRHALLPVTMQVTAEVGREWTHPIARKIGVTIRSVVPGGKIDCSWMKLPRMEYAELKGWGCKCSTQALGDLRTNSVLVVMQQEGEGRIVLKNRSYALQPGEWAVLPQAARYRSVSSSMLRLTMVRIAASDTWQERAGNEGFFLHSTQTADGGAFVRDFLRRLLADGRDSAETISFELSQALLLLLAFSRSSLAVEGVPVETLTTRIRCYVNEHLRDSELTLDRIASSLRCSKRSLHKAFSGEGISISEYIWRERLLKCRQQLGVWQEQRRSITEIALSWGFSNPSHFSTMFRAHFKESPRAYRNRCCTQSWLMKMESPRTAGVYLHPAA